MKLFQGGCKGLKEKDTFDGKKQNYGNFVKLNKRELSTIRTMVAPKWNIRGQSNIYEKVPTSDGTVKSSNQTMQLVNKFKIPAIVFRILHHSVQIHQITSEFHPPRLRMPLKFVPTAMHKIEACHDGK